MNKSVKLTLCELKDATIDIGFVGENLYRTLEIDCAEAYAEYPHAAASMTVQPPQEEAYPAVVERVGNSIVWTLTDSDLAQEGDGEFQLAFTSDEVVRRTWIGTFKIHRSIMPTGNAPSGIDDFLTRAGAALTAIPETIDAALEEAKESGEFDGYSPTVTVTDIQGGHRVSITDVNGTTTVDVMNGADGKDGEDGKDGFSPTVTVTDITGGHRVAITDATGTSSFDVMNGATGATPNITIGTVTTGAAGSDAAATMTGTPEDPVLNLTIPRGDPGEVSEEELQAVAEAKAPVVYDTVENQAIASVEDGADGMPMQVTVGIEPVQSGTGDPSPENIRPITGWTGCKVTGTGEEYYDASISPTDIRDVHVCIASTFTTLNITLPDPPGTVYGGTLTINKDGTGVLVVTHAIDDLGDFSWYHNDTQDFYYAVIDDIKQGYGANSDIKDVWCSCFKYKGAGVGWANMPNASYGIANSNIRVHLDGYTSASDFDTAVTGQKLVYPLATPVTYTLTAEQVGQLLSIKGNMNVFADTGDVISLDYPCDTKLYINKKLKASQNLMELIVTANHEDEMKATKAYTSGDLMIVNNKLYKATTSIANGATLTVGTNVSATTVAAEIAALS